MTNLGQMHLSYQNSQFNLSDVALVENNNEYAE